VGPWSLGKPPPVATRQDGGTKASVVARLVVPVDGSPFAERALPVAAWLAQELGAPIHLVEIADRDRGTESTIQYVGGLARRHAAATWEVIPGHDPGPAIIAATEAARPSLACLATHGRDRSAAVLGSVATSVLDHATDPVMLVGPKARPPSAGDAPIVTAVDGTVEDAIVVRVAADWAARLGRRLVVATVAEPVPPSFRESRPLHRARGPEDPEAYLVALAADMAETDLSVETRVAYDPISVRGGLLRLVDRTAALLVIGSHRHTRPLRALLGSHAARVVHDLEVPALVVPLDNARSRH
jgi:nucleotide-binding universal stress UspA family protein